MRKSILFMSAVAILAAASCQKELPAPSSDKAPVTFTASVDGADTKTVLNGNQSNWDGVEQIRVLDGTVSKTFTAEVENVPTAEFTEVDETVVLTGDDYLAIYPATQPGTLYWSGNIEESAKGFWLPDYQSAVLNSYNPAAHIAMAYTEAGNQTLEFKNVVSLVKLTVGNDNVGDITFKGNRDEQLAGNFNVTWNNGEPVVDFAEVLPNNAKTVIYLRDDKVNGGTYYFAVLPQTLEEGFTVEFNIETVKYAKTASAPYTIGRNQIIDLGTITFDVNPITYKTVSMRPSAVWENDEPACYAAWSWVKDGEGGWFKGTDSNEDGVYEFVVPEGNDMILFAALKSEELAWGDDNANVYNKTGDLSVPETDDPAYIVYSDTWTTVDAAAAYTEPTVTVYLKPSETWATAQSYGVYAFDDVKNMREWFEMTETTDAGIYTADIPEYYANVIFVAKSAEFSADWENKLAQTADLALPNNDNNACVVLSAVTEDNTASLWMTLDAAKVYEEPAQAKPVKITVTKNNDWDKLYIYAWTSEGNYGDWPGTDITETSEFEFNEDDFGTTVNYILNNGAGEQTVDLSEVLLEDFVFTLPSEANRFIVKYWPDDVANMHYWDSTLGGTEWPGVSLVKDNTYGYFYYDMPSGMMNKDFNFIINNGWQTKNLATTQNYVTKLSNRWVYEYNGDHKQ